MPVETGLRNTYDYQQWRGHDGAGLREWVCLPPLDHSTRLDPPAGPTPGRPALFPELLAADEVGGDRDIESRAEHSVGQGYGCELPGSEGREAAVPSQFM